MSIPRDAWLKILLTLISTKDCECVKITLLQVPTVLSRTKVIGRMSLQDRCLYSTNYKVSWRYFKKGDKHYAPYFFPTPPTLTPWQPVSFYVYGNKGKPKRFPVRNGTKLPQLQICTKDPSPPKIYQALDSPSHRTERSTHVFTARIPSRAVA